MVQLLLHLWGDYILQNHWMANTKTYTHNAKGIFACLLHVALYMTPFILFLHPSTIAIFVMAYTHFIIDHFRLAKYLCMLKNWHFEGNGNPGPEYLSVWLLFIVDNILHVTINYLSLTYL